MLSSPLFSDEIILEIFQHLKDTDLLSLVTISKHIHDLALLSHLARHGITESDIATHTFPQLTTRGAFRALCLARFVTGIDELRLRFDPGAALETDMRALANLARKVPIKSIDLEFVFRPASLRVAAGLRADMEGLIFNLISAFRSRPSVTISPLIVSIVRPHKPPFHGVRRLYSGMRALGSEKYVPTLQLIEEQEFRQGLVILPLMRAGGIIPNISIQTFDAPASVGTLIVLHRSGIADLRFPSHLRLSIHEMSDILANIKLPLLRGVEATFWNICPTALSAFLSHHPTLQRLRILGLDDPHRRAKAGARPPLPPDALPQLEHMLGSAIFVAWVLASPHPFPCLKGVTVELYQSVSTREQWHATLRGIASRPGLGTLSLLIYDWLPWARKNFDRVTAPESEVSNIVDLRLTFKFLLRPGIRDLPLLVEWLKLFRSVREVSLFDKVPIKDMCAVLGKECPQIKFTSYKLGK